MVGAKVVGLICYGGPIYSTQGIILNNDKVHAWKKS